LAGYNILQKSYSANKRSQGVKTQDGGTISDLFLIELCEAYNFYQKEGKWPQLQWHKLPSLHSARFNSQRIFAFRNGEISSKLLATSLHYVVKGMVFKTTLFRGFIQSAAYCCLQIELS